MKESTAFEHGDHEENHNGSGKKAKGRKEALRGIEKGRADLAAIREDGDQGGGSQERPEDPCTDRPGVELYPLYPLYQSLRADLEAVFASEF